jgi:DamX protein
MASLVNYKSVLDLEKDPFSPEPDAKFYYAFSSFEQRLALLKRLVEGTDILVLVIGEAGSGKTTLLKRYLSFSGKIWASGKIGTGPAAAKSADPNVHGSVPAYVQLDSQEPIVIVDDAHALTREELMFLLREAIIPGSSQMIKRLVLFGESDLYAAITSFSDSIIGETTINKIYMSGMNSEEATAYLQHRLRVSGYKGDSLFSTSVIKKIHKMSGGFPGPMNENADQWLKNKYSGNVNNAGTSRRLTARPGRIIAWALAGFAVLLLAAVLYYSYSNTTVSKTEPGKAAGKVFRAKIPENPESTERVFRAKIPVGQHAVESIAKTETSPPAEQKSVTSQSVISPPQKEKQAAETIPPMEKAPPLPETAELSEKKLPTRIETQPPPQKPEPVEKIVLPKEQPLPTPAPGVKKEITEKVEKRSIRREDWLLSQNSGYYTIQIMGVSNESTLPGFIKKYRLLEQNEIAYYQTTFRGKPWFQLLYGIYPSMEEARKAAEKLPEKIRSFGPWIRRVAAVQKSIRGAR